MTPLTHPDGQREQGHGVVLHVQEEVYQSTLTFRRSRVPGMMPWIHQAKNFDVLFLHIPGLS